MLLFPAIDLFEGKAVRLFQGRYDRMTVYSEDPLSVAEDFKRCGAKAVHLVDLEGARDGTMPNRDLILKIKKRTGLFCEVGGGIRTFEAAESYLSAGMDRVIFGTAAVEDPALVRKTCTAFPGQVAIGADLKDGMVAIKGWKEQTALSADSFLRKMLSLGVDTFIVTDISRDGAMKGTSAELYRRLATSFPVRLTASGGISSLDDLKLLRDIGLYGVIIGKAYYTGAIDLKQAEEVVG